MGASTHGRSDAELRIMGPELFLWYKLRQQLQQLKGRRS